ncbi:TniQ family protein [Vibrio fluvialis]|nr:TniQ family protein [Vibrio fluvialis]MBY7941649.1 TniQ family protein [Vibrio fluvialis]
MSEERWLKELYGKHHLNHLWPIHLHPIYGESLYSWLLRLAKAHHLTAQSFGHLIWPGTPIWTRDIDLFAPPTVTSTLARFTSTHISQCLSTTLRYYDGIYYEKCHPTQSTPLLLPVGVRHRNRLRYGQQFCPYCIANNAYLKLEWRLAHITYCKTHNSLLLDSCPHCGKPAAFHRYSNWRHHLLDCVYCKHSMLPTHFNRENIISPQLSCRDAWATHLTKKTVFVNSNLALHCLAFFKGLRLLTKLLLGSTSGKAWKGLKSIGYKEVLSTSLESNILEYQRIATRHKIFNACSWILDDWPIRFAQLISASTLTYSELVKGCHPIPYWIQESIQKLGIYKKKYSPSFTELSAAKHYLDESHSYSKDSLMKLTCASHKNKNLRPMVNHSHHQKTMKDVSHIHLLEILAHTESPDSYALFGLRKKTLRQISLIRLLQDKTGQSMTAILKTKKSSLFYDAIRGCWYVSFAPGLYTDLRIESPFNTAVCLTINHFMVSKTSYLFPSNSGGQLRLSRFNNNINTFACRFELIRRKYKII